MRWRRRALRMSLWACGLAAVVAFGVTGVSGFYFFGWIKSDGRAFLGVRHGAFFLNLPTGPPKPFQLRIGSRGGWWITAAVPRGPNDEPQWLFIPRTYDWDAAQYEVWIPTAPVGVLAAAAAGFLAWKTRRRRGPGLCSTCGYDLNGLARGAACPECGAAAAGIDGGRG